MVSKAFYKVAIYFQNTHNMYFGYFHQAKEYWHTFSDLLQYLKYRHDYGNFNLAFYWCAMYAYLSKFRALNRLNRLVELHHEIKESFKEKQSPLIVHFSDGSFIVVLSYIDIDIINLLNQLNASLPWSRLSVSCVIRSKTSKWKFVSGRILWNTWQYYKMSWIVTFNIISTRTASGTLFRYCYHFNHLTLVREDKCLSWSCLHMDQWNLHINTMHCLDFTCMRKKNIRIRQTWLSSFFLRLCTPWMWESVFILVVAKKNRNILSWIHQWRWLHQRYHPELTI